MHLKVLKEKNEKSFRESDEEFEREHAECVKKYKEELEASNRARRPAWLNCLGDTVFYLGDTVLYYIPTYTRLALVGIALLTAALVSAHVSLFFCPEEQARIEPKQKKLLRQPPKIAPKILSKL